METKFYVVTFEYSASDQTILVVETTKSQSELIEYYKKMSSARYISAYAADGYRVIKE